MKTYTVAEAAAMARVKPRTLQFWTMNNVVMCDPLTRHGGPGVRRQYEIEEIAIAALLGVVSRASIPVGQLKDAATAIRTELQRYPRSRKSDREAQVQLLEQLYRDAERRARDLNLKNGRPIIGPEFQVDVAREINRRGHDVSDTYHAWHWHLLWTAIERDEDFLVVLSYSDDEEWSVSEVFPPESDVREIWLEKMPARWGLLFVINTEEAFRDFP